MKSPLIILLFSAIACAGTSAVPAVRFNLSAPADQLVLDAKAFEPFAAQVRTQVEHLLGVPAALDDPATFKLLLSSRVHLAHDSGDNRTAVATAAWIRSLQTDPALKAFAGLTTFAAVEARAECPGVPPGDAAFRAKFEAAFKRQLAGLPWSEAIVAMLRGQREKIDGLSREALVREVREGIMPQIASRGYCGLNEADQLVRVRHRLTDILPLREEMLSAFDVAIAERTHS